jgi:Mg/Co/Ni transporter MgtE
MLSQNQRKALSESLGFASKAAGVAPKKQIVQVDETMSRWQMLAGITKY